MPLEATVLRFDQDRPGSADARQETADLPGELVRLLRQIGRGRQEFPCRRSGFARRLADAADADRHRLRRLAGLLNVMRNLRRGRALLLDG